MASATAVASSSIDAPATGRPVRSSTIVWKLSSASSRPWLISGWYGRVRGVPGRALEHVAADHGRRDRVVVAEADHRGEYLVAVGQRAQLGGGLRLGGRRRQGQRQLLADAGGHGVGEQVVHGWRSRGTRACAAGRLAALTPMCRAANGAPCSRSARLRSVICGPSSTEAPRRQRRGVRDSPSVGRRPPEWPAARWFLCLRGSGEVAPSALATTASTDSPTRVNGRFRRYQPANSAAASSGGRGALLRAAAPVRRRASQGRRIARCSTVGTLAGQLRKDPTSSRSAPLTAMPNTPWPPRSRSTTSSEEVHS